MALPSLYFDPHLDRAKAATIRGTANERNIASIYLSAPSIVARIE